MPDRYVPVVLKAGDKSPGDWGLEPRQFEFKEPNESVHGKLAIKLLRSKLAAGETGELEVAYTHYEGFDLASHKIYNPFFNKLLRPPSFAIAVYDRDKKFISDLAYVGGMSQRIIRLADFVDLQVAGQIVGGRVPFQTTAAMNPDPPFKYERLHLGKWSLQIVLLDRFYAPKFLSGPKPLSPPERLSAGAGADVEGTFGLESDHHDGAVEGFLKMRPGKEFLRSNVVEIEVVAKA